MAVKKKRVPGVKKNLVVEPVRVKPVVNVQKKSSVGVSRSRRSPLSGVWSFIMWLVGVLVSLAVGFGMVDGVLMVPKIPLAVTAIAGWIVVVLVLIGALLKVIDKISGA